MSDDVDAIKFALTDARDLLDALGVLQPGAWSRNAKGILIRCPWHDEKTPSCLVSDARGGYPIMAHCFGCEANADVFAIIAQAYDLDVRANFRDVIDLAADLAGMPRPERKSPGDRPATARTIPRRDPPVRVEPTPDDGILTRIAAVLASVAPVTASVAAMGYLRERGIDHTEARDWYALPDGPARDEVVAAVLDEIGFDEWIASGLATSTGEHAGRWAWSWRGPRLVIPWRSPDRSVNALQGRYMGREPDGVRRYAYPTGRSPSWPYGVDVLAAQSREVSAVVCEGAISAASFNALARTSGVNAYAVATGSAGAWDARWFRCFVDRRCIVAFDNDKTGREKAEVMAERLRAVARRGDVTVRLPAIEGDWNDVLRARAAREVA